MNEREQAIQDFLKINAIEEKLSEAFAAIVGRRPLSVLIFWEEDNGYGAITIPHSRALSYGLATRAYELLVEEEDGDNYDEESVDED